MHSAVVSSVRIFWNRCRELSDKERVHALKVNCHCIVAYDTNVDTDTFSFPHTRSIRRMSFCCMKNIESIIAFRGTPQCKIAKYQMEGEEEITTSQSSASMQVFAAVMVFSECSLNNCCHFCRILKIPYQALIL